VTTVKKLPAKFDVFRLRRSLLQPGFDVNQSLQVETDGIHNRSASGSDLHDRAHVKLFDLLTSLRFKLPSIRRMLLNLVDDHVKHVLDHVRLSVKLPCSNAITSNCAWNFLAEKPSRQTSTETSLLRRDRVVIQPLPSLPAIFVGTFGLALVAKLTSGRFLCARLVIFGGPMPAIRAEMPGIFALSTSISCFHVGGPPLDFKQEDFKVFSYMC